MNACYFIIGALATWRITVLFARDAGPWDVFKRLRKITRLSKLLSCPFCVSVWAGALVCVIYKLSGVIETGLIWCLIALAMSAISIALDRTFTADYQT